LNGCSFAGTTNFVKNGLANDAGVGGNTFTGASVFTNNGTGYFMSGNGLPDQWLGSATFNNNGGGIIYIAHSHSLSTTTFNGPVVVNNNSTVSGNPGIRFAEAGTSAIVTFNGSVVVNNAGTGNTNLVLFAQNSGGNIVNFNSTLSVNQTNTGTSAYTQFGGTATINLNDNVVLNNSAGASSWIGFTMNGGTTTLASGRTITVGAGGFTTGILYLRRFVQLGGTAQNIVMGGIGNLTVGPGSVFNANFAATSPSILLNGGVFNAISNFNKTGNAADYSTGSNIFNAVSTFTNTGNNFLVLGNATPDIWNADVNFINSGSERLLPAWNSAGNQFNGNIYVNSIGSSIGIHFCGGSTSASATLASTKTIAVGGTGYTSGYLIMPRFTQLGNAPVNLAFSSTASYIQFGPTSVMGGNVTTDSPRIYLQGCLFQGTSSFTKTGSVADHSDGGNTFTGACTFNHNGTGNFLTGAVTFDTWLSTATFNNNNSGVIYLGHSHSGTTSVFNGLVTINNLSSGTGNPGVRFGEAASSVGVIFNAPVVINNAGSGSGNYVTFSGSTGANTITFNNTVTVNQTNTGTGAITYFGNQGTILLNDNVVVNNTSGPSSWVGFSMNGGSTILANGKTLTIGSTGFANGNLYLRRFNQIGATAQNFTLTGNASLVYGPTSNFDAGVVSSSPGLAFNGCTFNSTTNCTKTGSFGDNSAGNNLFVGNSIISNTAGGNITFGNGASDTWMGNATFNNSGSAIIYIAHNHNGIATSFNGTVTINVTSGGTTAAGVRFAEASSSGTVNFNAPVIVNNAGAGSSNYVGFANSTAGNIINFNSTLTVNQTNTGTSALTIIGNTSTINLNGNVELNNTSGASSWIGFSNAGGTTTLANGKTITIGSTGFSNGTLYLRRLTQIGSTPQTLNLSGSALLAIQNGSLFNANLNYSSPQVIVEASTFNGTSRFTKIGGSNNYSAGGNTFNGPTHFINTSIADFGLANGTGDDFNNLARFVQTGTGLMRPVHNATSTFSGNIAADSCSTAITFGTAALGIVIIDGNVSQVFSGDAAYAQSIGL
jgi:hypothetical protein